jgi:hypothetical protein
VLRRSKARRSTCILRAGPLTIDIAGRDIVLADRKGRRFYAFMTERREHQLELEPIDRLTAIAR